MSNKYYIENFLNKTPVQIKYNIDMSKRHNKPHKNFTTVFYPPHTFFIDYEEDHYDFLRNHGGLG
jgi:hypothetical protein